jgi:hypothetical protein
MKVKKKQLLHSFLKSDFKDIQKIHKITKKN